MQKYCVVSQWILKWQNITLEYFFSFWKHFHKKIGTYPILCIKHDNIDIDADISSLVSFLSVESDNWYTSAVWHLSAVVTILSVSDRSWLLQYSLTTCNGFPFKGDNHGLWLFSAYPGVTCICGGTQMQDLSLLRKWLPHWKMMAIFLCMCPFTLLVIVLMKYSVDPWLNKAGHKKEII